MLRAAKRLAPRNPLVRRGMVVTGNHLCNLAQRVGGQEEASFLPPPTRDLIRGGDRSVFVSTTVHPAVGPGLAPSSPLTHRSPISPQSWPSCYLCPVPSFLPHSPGSGLSFPALDPHPSSSHTQPPWGLPTLRADPTLCLLIALLWLPSAPRQSPSPKPGIQGPA